MNERSPDQFRAGASPSVNLALEVLQAKRQSEKKEEKEKEKQEYINTKAKEMAKAFRDKTSGTIEKSFFIETKLSASKLDEYSIQYMDIVLAFYVLIQPERVHQRYRVSAPILFTGNKKDPDQYVLSQEFKFIEPSKKPKKDG